jgi:hypothetical protein
VDGRHDSFCERCCSEKSFMSFTDHYVILLRLPECIDSRHIKVVRLSDLSSGHLYPVGKIPGTHFFWNPSPPHSHGAVERIQSIRTVKFPVSFVVFQMKQISCTLMDK